ncbi:MAG: hypothetical protein A3G25_04480 [Betaproteobacteria bacterium RIFCSPLOWO2_12_FULL_63_13]|nr:MAG: hypothetical protein A3H32_10345 [Betaproteobacteria bacterium RIFCSPLOWO2_02_FULL_63_19]OGA45504.1 MAG: hypothetical protein A3G25_04480 [Betaproteobacteria bacterium RIFCSPLOWO2_12_FULL_63_13]
MKPRKTSRIVVACIGLLMALRAQGELPVIRLNAGIHVIRAEVANTFETRARGLMYREALGPNQGMLFVFPRLERHCMWMKNTPLPLSVAFIDDDGEVISLSEMAPHTENSHCAARPVRFALEMTTGWFESRGIRAGGKLLGLERAPPPR